MFQQELLTNGVSRDNIQAINFEQPEHTRLLVGVQPVLCAKWQHREHVCQQHLPRHE